MPAVGILGAHEQAGGGRPRGARAGWRWASSRRMSRPAVGVLEANEQAGGGRPQGARAGRQWASSIEARMQAREAHEQAGGGHPRGAHDRS